VSLRHLAAISVGRVVYYTGQERASQSTEYVPKSACDVRRSVSFLVRQDTDRCRKSSFENQISSSQQLPVTAFAASRCASCAMPPQHFW
jgi:hypothetical protein